MIKLLSKHAMRTQRAEVPALTSAQKGSKEGASLRWHHAWLGALTSCGTLKGGLHLSPNTLYHIYDDDRVTKLA